MSAESATPIITAILGAVFGGGGVFAYLTAMKKQKSADTTDAANEWKCLYETMRQRNEEQEQENKRLAADVEALKNQVLKLSAEIENYRRYDGYISDLESYNRLIMGVAGPLLTPESLEMLDAQKPIRPIGLVPPKNTNTL